MKLAYQRNDRLPPLAWIATLMEKDQFVHVEQGRLVEVRDGFFVEGVWDGRFESGGFHTTDCFFGSGAIQHENGITFVSSAATTDYLFYGRQGKVLHVSNSLPLLLAARGDELIPDEAEYSRINESLLFGIYGYRPEIPTKAGVVRRAMVRNVVVKNELLGLEEVEKPLPPRFRNFAEYRSYLDEHYKRIALNARDPARKNPLKIYSTQSKGYDSTAVNAIASKYGIDAVFTVSKGKGHGAFADKDQALQVDDDGSEICAALGLKCMPINRRAFEDKTCDEHLFWAALDNNADLNLVEVSDRMSVPSILLTGCLGEIYYPASYFEKKYPYSQVLRDTRECHEKWGLPRGDLGLYGLTEFRLAAGFVHVAPIFIGARRFSDILAITQSNEMDKWRLRREYDRPIARRIAEDMGVPRALFGQAKRASAVEFAPPYVPRGKALRREFESYLRHNGILRQWQIRLIPLVHKLNTVVLFHTPHRYAWLYYVERLMTRIARKSVVARPIWERFNGCIYTFAVNRRVQEYSLARGERTSERDLAEPVEVR